jgi:hypothetical protein
MIVVSHRSQRRAEQLAIGAGDLRVVGGVIDEALRLVDSIQEVRQPVAGQIRFAASPRATARERSRTRPARYRVAAPVRRRSTA